MPARQILLAAILGSVFSVSALAQESTEKQMPSEEKIRKEAQANTKYLAATVLKKAKSILEDYGPFAPFGAGLFQDGEVNFVWAVKPGESTEGVNPVLVLNAVRTALNTQAKSGRILGSAVVYQYRDSDGNGDLQINVELEYLNGYAEVVATQYEKGPDGVEFTGSANSPYDARIFTGLDEGSNQ